MTTVCDLGEKLLAVHDASGDRREVRARVGLALEMCGLLEIEGSIDRVLLQVLASDRPAPGTAGKPNKN